MSATDPAPRKSGPKPKTIRPRVSLNVRVDPVLKEFLDRFAHATYRTVNASASLALERGLMLLLEEEKLVLPAPAAGEVEHR